MIKSDIVFSGYYGEFNTGDDAFIEVASWGAYKFWNKRKNTFLGVGSKLPEIKNPVRGYPLSIPKTFQLQKKLLIKNTGYFISAGGSTIHSTLSRSSAKYLALEEKRKSGRLKIGAIGVSVGPFKSVRDEKDVVDYLKSIDFIALRDKRSYEYVNSIPGLSYKPIEAFDLAALLPSIYQERGPKKISSRKVVGVSLCKYESYHSGGDLKNELRRNIRIAEIISRLDKQENICFKFIVFNGNSKSGDMDVTNELISKVKPKNVELVQYNSRTEVMWDEIASCDFMLATRLHAGIFSCFANIPFMQIEYHKKCSDFLDDVGYLDDFRIGDAELDANIVSEKIVETLSKDDQPQFVTKSEQMADKAKLNFTSFVL